MMMPISASTYLALLVCGKPFCHDVGVGKRTFGHGGQEEHGGRGEPVHVELAVQALYEVVYDA